MGPKALRMLHQHIAEAGLNWTGQEGTRAVDAYLAELAAIENGGRIEYYDDGQHKAVGPMRNGQLHGRWKLFRRDGTLMRSGQFSLGEQFGTWTTFDRAGNPTKTTTF